MAVDYAAPVARLSRKQRFAAAFTPTRRDAVEAYIAYLQDHLRLKDWVLSIDWSRPAPKDALAAITPMGDSKHATIRFSEKFVTAAPALRTQTLVHELMHCHLFALEDLGSATVAALASKQAASVFEVAHNSAVERTVDGLADAFACTVSPFVLP